VGKGATQVFGIPETGRPEFRYFGILVAFSGEFLWVGQIVLGQA
jgi:hypothetical protein